mgnify:CR=1 FL=1
MKRAKRIGCLIIGLMLCCSARLYAANVSGMVLDALQDDDGNPIPLEGVRVTIDGKSVTSWEYGIFHITGVSNGTHQLTGFLNDNYTIAPVTIEVTGDVTQNLIATGKSEVLGVPLLKSNKDTAMLCLCGCPRQDPEGEHRDHVWNRASQSQAGGDADLPGPHAIAQCWAVSVKMINHYYGGSITQDEICWSTRGTVNNRNDPKWDLAHNQGAHPGRSLVALKYALDDADLESITDQPTTEQIKAYIEAGRPLFWAARGHAMVVDGYRYRGNVFELHYLNKKGPNDDDSAINNGYATWAAPEGDHFAMRNGCVPPPESDGRIGDYLIRTDMDSDGVCDFDEYHRWAGNESFSTHMADWDTDDDWLCDGKDIEGWVFRAAAGGADGGGGVWAPYDPDFDNQWCEADIDSDNAGVRDGDEDADGDAWHDGADEETPFDETYPYDRFNDVDDIPCANVEVSAANYFDEYVEEPKTVVKAGDHTLYFYLVRNDGETALPVNLDRGDGAPQIGIKFAPNEGAPIDITLTRMVAEQSYCVIWRTDLGSALTVAETEKNGKGVFVFKNGNRDVEIVSVNPYGETQALGNELYVDTEKTTLGDTVISD